MVAKLRIAMPAAWLVFAIRGRIEHELGVPHLDDHSSQPLLLVDLLLGEVIVLALDDGTLDVFFVIYFENYKISPDWSGSQLCGLHFSWNYPAGTVDVTMPTYIPALIRKLNYSPKLPQYSPHPMAPFSIPTAGQR